jgi:hypothetical protein
MSFYKEFDPRDLDQCEVAVMSLWGEIMKHHGPVIAERLFAERTHSKQSAREMRNVWLLIRYLRSRLSVKKFAAKLAERNKSLPPGHRTPNGGTNAEAIEKQIRRLKKSTPPDHRGAIKYMAKDNALWANTDIS